MASKKTLNAKNLEALGAERLAELLIEISTANAAAKRRLCLELAGAQSPIEVAKELRKRLIAIERSRSFIDWQNRKTLIEDLETQRRAIVDQVAKADLAEALELLWRFMALANSVFGRCDHSSGTMVGIFHAACRAVLFPQQIDEELALLGMFFLEPDGKRHLARQRVSADLFGGLCVANCAGCAAC